MTTADIYLDFYFLKSLIEREPPRFSQEHQWWYSLCSFLLSSPPSVRFFRADTGKQIPHSDLSRLLHQSIQDPAFHQQMLGVVPSLPVSDYHYTPDTDWLREIENSSTFLFISWPSEACHAVKQAGIFAANFEELLSQWTLLVDQLSLQVVAEQADDIIPLTSRLSSWQDLNRYQLPINAMLILDNYPGNSEQEVKENLVEMVRALVPVDAERLELMLVYATDWQAEKKARQGEAPRGPLGALEFAHLLETELTRLLPSTDLTVSVIRAPHAKKGHDRHIITNYGFFTSGNSFTYFRRGELDPRKETYFNVAGLLCPGTLELTSELRSRYQAIVSVTEDDAHFYRVVGTKEHRLIKDIFN